MTPEHAQWLNAEIDHFRRAQPDERAVILRDVERLAQSQHPETAEWNAALYANLTAKNLPVEYVEKQPKRLEPPTWGEVTQVMVWAVKLAAPPAILIGGGYLAVTVVTAGAAGLKIWLLANGWVFAVPLGALALVFCVSGLFSRKTDDSPQPGAHPAQPSEGGSVGANGGNIIIQQFIIHGDGNTVVNNQG